MNYKQLSGTDINCSVIGLGCLHFGVYLNDVEANCLVKVALEHGVNFFETGPMYGNGQSELILGRVLKNEEVYISTKAGLEPCSVNGQFSVKKARLRADYLRQSVENSLKQLDRETVDLFQLHAFDEWTPVEETAAALESLIGQGKIRALGCSNYSPQELTQALAGGLKFSTVQCHYNLLERRVGDMLKPLIERHELNLLCNRAMARGLLSAKYTTMGDLPKGSRASVSERIRATLNEDVIDTIKRLSELAAKLGLTCAQLALRWVLSNGGQPLIGVRSTAQLEECLKAPQVLLTEAQITAIDQMLSDLNYMKIANSQPENFLEL